MSAPTLFSAKARSSMRAASPHNPHSDILGRMGTLVVTLAETREELDAVQRLRFQVFHEEFGACNSAQALASQRDTDRFDPFCDHLLVIDETLPGERTDKIVGTYRLMRQDMADRHGFYTASEFDIYALMKRHKNRNFLELGRSCVLSDYRSRRTIELLWQGIWAYCRRHGIDVMVGCASFKGTIPAEHALGLSFLHHHARLDPRWSAKAIAQNSFSLDLMPAEAIDPRQAVLALPPLIKGYLRIGGLIGEGGVIDHEFGSIDVFIGLPVENIAARYINHYGENADRFIA